MDTKEKKRNTASAGTRSRERVRQKKKPVDQDVVYTPPKPFNRGKFLLRLATVAAVVLALVLGLSIFFKVETITVSGMEKYTAWDVREASGIEDGENLLTLSKTKISGNIIANLPYVATVQVGIELPNTVNIQITEIEMVYAIQAKDETWWLINADGRVIESINTSEAEDYTRILGILVEPPQVGDAAVAVEPEVDEETAEFTAPVVTLGRDYLEVAKTIMQYLEGNGIIGQIATIDVSDLGNIELWYGKRFQILLGDSSGLDYKISAVRQAIDQTSDYQTGILDASFTIWADKVILTQFS